MRREREIMSRVFILAQDLDAYKRASLRFERLGSHGYATCQCQTCARHEYLGS